MATCCINAQRALIEANRSGIDINKIAVICLTCKKLWASEKANVKEI